MLSHPDSTRLCQLTAAQIQSILVLNGVMIQQYQPRSLRWRTIVQLPGADRLMLELDIDRVREIDAGLHRHEIIEFTATTTVVNINICNRYVFLPLIHQAELWGRICLLGNFSSVWTSQDLAWVKALGQQLLMMLNILRRDTIPTNLSPIANLEPFKKIAELEQVCQRKDDFINNISHDLRAPLMNIKMAVRMLTISLNTDVDIAELLIDHRAKKYLSILEKECEREIELINNILDLQRLELEIEQVNIESVEIATWLPSAIEPFMHRADTRQQQLTTSLSERISTIDTNRIYLTKIITELLNNACKYTQVDGKILLSIDSPPNSEWLTITIKNQADIEAKHLTRIFDQFYRIPGSDRSGQGGTGLGLSLVQKLVIQLNGRIDVASTNGWTEFAVKLPISS